MNEGEKTEEKLPDRLYIQFTIENPQEVYYLNDEISGVLKIESTFEKTAKIKFLDIWLKENWEEQKKGEWLPQREILERFGLEEKFKIAPGESKEYEFSVPLSSPWAVKEGEEIREWKLSLGFYYREGKQEILGYPYENAQFTINIDKDNPIRPQKKEEVSIEVNKCPKCGWILSQNAEKCPIPTCGWNKAEDIQKQKEEMKAQAKADAKKANIQKHERIDELLKEIPEVERQISDVDQRYWDKSISQEEYMKEKTALYEKLGTLQGELEKLQSP